MVDAQAADDLAIDHVVLAELHGGPRRDVDLRQGLAELDITIIPLSDGAAVRAGRAHGAYRRRGGRGATLADFLIGGHAAVLGLTLLARDRGRFVSYLPELTIIAPEASP